MDNQEQPDFWVKYEFKDGEEIVTGSANALRAQQFLMFNAEALKQSMHGEHDESRN